MAAEGTGEQKHPEQKITREMGGFVLQVASTRKTSTLLARLGTTAKKIWAPSVNARSVLGTVLRAVRHPRAGETELRQVLQRRQVLGASRHRRAPRQHVSKNPSIHTAARAREIDSFDEVRRCFPSVAKEPIVTTKKMHAFHCVMQTSLRNPEHLKNT